MRVLVKLFAMLRAERFDEKEMEFPAGTTAGDVVRFLGIPEREVTLIFVNGRHSESGTVLGEGDMLALFPPIGGG